MKRWIVEIKRQKKVGGGRLRISRTRGPRGVCLAGKRRGVEEGGGFRASAFERARARKRGEKVDDDGNICRIIPCRGIEVGNI